MGYKLFSFIGDMINKPGQPIQRHKSFTDSAVFAFIYVIQYSVDLPIVE